MEKKYNISESEWIVMQVLWASKHPITIGEIAECLQDKSSWSKRTIQTLIQRLVKKSIVDYDDGRYFKYYALVSEKQCLKDELKNLIDRLFYSSPSKLVATLVESESYTPEDKKEILDLLSEIEERHSNE